VAEPEVDEIERIADRPASALLLESRKKREASKRLEASKRPNQVAIRSASTSRPSFALCEAREACRDRLDAARLLSALRRDAPHRRPARDGVHARARAQRL